MTVRPFTSSDYAAYVAVANASYPDYARTLEETKHDDGTWDDAKYFKARLIAEERGRVVGIADLRHERWAFVSDKYWLDVAVDPAHRRRGHGSALYEAALAIARARAAAALNAGTKESMADGVRFLEGRGFREVKRDWESRLQVKGFDFSPFATADERVAREGIRITTLAEQMAGEAGALRRTYELARMCSQDVPSVDPPTMLPFETWRSLVLEGPGALPDAYFLAVHRDGRYVGLSNMSRSTANPSFLWHQLTGVLRDARGKGIAMALKLRTVRYAQEHGADHIKTWNDSHNRPMLAINEALGFEKQPVWIAYQKDLAAR